MSKKVVAMAATAATDSILDGNGGLLEKREGGPALFISAVLEEEGIPFLSLAIPRVEVEIMVRKDGEFGKIPNRPAAVTLPFHEFETPFLILSTILDEVSLDGISRYKGKTFLDIQGYVRDGSNFGAKRFFEPPSEMADSIFCLKGTSEELLCLPKKFIKSQKQKMLIETNGKEGSILFTKNGNHEMPAREVGDLPNTIGAGDTFFASFLSKFISTEDPRESAVYATEKTAFFLTTKKKPTRESW